MNNFKVFEHDCNSYLFLFINKMGCLKIIKHNLNEDSLVFFFYLRIFLIKVQKLKKSFYDLKFT